MHLDIATLSRSAVTYADKERVAKWLTNGHKTLIELYVTADSEREVCRLREELIKAVDEHLPWHLGGVALQVIGNMRQNRKKMEEKLVADTHKLEQLARRVERLKLTPFARFSLKLRWRFKRQFIQQKKLA